MSLGEYLTRARPFGPIDQTKIEDLHFAVELLDLYEPFSSAINGDFSLIYGRKGSGKSAVISLFQGFRHVEHRLRKKGMKVGKLHKNSIFIPVKTWDHFMDMNVSVKRQISDMVSMKQQNEVDYDLIPVEIIEAAWVDQIWEEIFRKFFDLIQDGDILEEEFPNVVLCFDDEAMAQLRGTPEYIASKIFQDAKKDIIEYLNKKKTSAYILFDSMEKYPISNEAFGMCMGGFLRAINHIYSSQNRIRVIFALPEELVQFFRNHSENILKDFEKAFPLRWEPRDLLRIVAHRYRLFLSIYDKSFYEELKRVDFHEDDDLRGFYSQLFPMKITNELGDEEPTLAYLIRHTQLLPRHFILALNQISILSNREVGNWREFSSKAVVKGVKTAEDSIAEEILKPYSFIYRDIVRQLKGVMGDLSPIFSYGELHSCMKRITKTLDMTHTDLAQILLKWES